MVNLTVTQPAPILYEAHGELKSAYAWSQDPRCPVSRKAFIKRIEGGMSVEDALAQPGRTVGSPTGRVGSVATAFGETKSVHAWSEDPRCQVSRTMLRKRLTAGMPLEEALQKEASRRPNFELKEAFGERKPLLAWSRDPRCVVAYTTLYQRVSEGWSVADALTVRLVAPPRSIEIAGVTKRVGEWAADPICQVEPWRIRARIKDGMSPQEAVTTPPPALRLYEAWGEGKTVTEWANDDRCVVTRNTLYERLAAGVPIEAALTRSEWSPVSFGEEQMADFIERLGVNAIRNNRDLIRPREIDVYVPECRLAVEFNGVLWHTERYVGRDRHFAKWQACREQNVQLIHVWQDDWLNRRPIVERMLAAKLGRSNERRVSARSTTAGFEERPAPFLELNHLQGTTGASHHVGLRDAAGELVAVASFQQAKIPGRWVLARFATSCRVVGGLGKCLAFFTRQVPVTTIRTFADNGVSNGALYERTGFKQVSTLEPDYSYVVAGRRVHKFNYRLARFRDDPALQYVEGATESQLAELNGLNRIWDAGKTVWELDTPASA